MIEATRRRPRLGVIGAGAWGINHVRLLATDPGCELIAVADHDPAARARALQISPHVRLYEDARALIDDRTIDGVVISSPARTHAELSIAALVAGKHVLVEKPAAMTLADARRVEHLAASSGTAFLIGHLMVYHPAVVRLRDLLRSGELGRLHYVHSTRANLGRLRQDENALWSFGPHELSMLDYLIGQMPATVTARGQCVLQPSIEDVVFVTLRYRTGQMAHLHLSWLHPRKERTLTVVCSRKMVEFDDVSAEKLRIYDKGYDQPPNFTHFSEYLTIRDGDVFIPQVPLEEPLRVQLRHFLDCIHGRAEPLTNAASGTRSVAILEAAQHSLAQDGAPVSLDVQCVHHAAVSDTNGAR